jgi:hypothetical protein
VSDTPTDPMGMFRQMVDQWEKMTNEYGGKMLKTPEFAQGMQGVSAITLQIQTAVHEAMTKVLSAANMPSKDDFGALAERIGRIEAQLARIEAASIAPRTADTSKPARTKQPPKAK